MGQRLVAATTRGTQKGMGGKGMEVGNDIPSPSSPFGESVNKLSGSGGGLSGFLGRSAGAGRLAGGIFRGFGQGRASGFGQTDKSYSKSYLDESKG